MGKSDKENCRKQEMCAGAGNIDRKPPNAREEELREKTGCGGACGGEDIAAKERIPETKCPEKEEKGKPQMEEEQREKQNKEQMRQKEREEEKDAQETGELEKVRLLLDEKTRQCEEYFNALQRIAAEFDNFKKRTAREKESLYAEAVSDVVAAFLPVVDSVEKAVLTYCGQQEERPIKEGLELINRQVKDVLKRLEVMEIKSLGEDFDPQLHEAVMHVEDEEKGKNIVVEELRKGYVFKDRVIRHSMVKVAN